MFVVVSSQPFNAVAGGVLVVVVVGGTVVVVLVVVVVDDVVVVVGVLDGAVQSGSGTTLHCTTWPATAFAGSCGHHVPRGAAGTGSV